MFGPLGGFELLVLAVIGLLVFGPRKLPEIGRSVGKVIGEFRRAATELRTSIEREINLEEVQKATRTVQDEVEESMKELDPRRHLGLDESEGAAPEERGGSSRQGGTGSRQRRTGTSPEGRDEGDEGKD